MVRTDILIIIVLSFLALVINNRETLRRETNKSLEPENVSEQTPVEIDSDIFEENKPVIESNSKKLLETDVQGGFNYNHLRINKGGNPFGQNGAPAEGLISKPDVMNNVDLFRQQRDVIYQPKNHYLADGTLSKPDVATGADTIRVMYMNRALDQLRNVQQNAHKSNVDPYDNESKSILAYSNSKYLAPNFSPGYHEYSKKIEIQNTGVHNEIAPSDPNIEIESRKREINSLILKK